MSSKGAGGVSEWPGMQPEVLVEMSRLIRLLYDLRVTGLLDLKTAVWLAEEIGSALGRLDDVIREARGKLVSRAAGECVAAEN